MTSLNLRKVSVTKKGLRCGRYGFDEIVLLVAGILLAVGVVGAVVKRATDPPKNSLEAFREVKRIT